MKRLTYVLAALVFLTGCTKKQQKENNALIGKWRLIAIFESPGAGGSWHTYTGIPVVIEFTADGNFYYTSAFPKASLQLNKYTRSGNALAMSSTNSTNTDTWYIGYVDNIRLDLSIYTCIEPCAYRFVPV